MAVATRHAMVIIIVFQFLIKRLKGVEQLLSLFALFTACRRAPTVFAQEGRNAPHGLKEGKHSGRTQSGCKFTHFF
jgi:hypothetical protein